jgi:hypothetical protein
MNLYPAFLNFNSKPNQRVNDLDNLPNKELDTYMGIYMIYQIIPVHRYWRRSFADRTRCDASNLLSRSLNFWIVANPQTLSL